MRISIIHLNEKKTEIKLPIRGLSVEWRSNDDGDDRRCFSNGRGELLLRFSSHSLDNRLCGRDFFCSCTSIVRLCSMMVDDGRGLPSMLHRAFFVISPCKSCSPFTSVRPRIFNISATRNSGPISAWLTFISPLYINSTIAFNSVHFTSRIMMIGCWQGLSKNKDWKYGEQADSTILWAFIDWLSHASVTSTNDSFCSNWSNTFVKLRP